jgi:hypothetical protein
MERINHTVVIRRAATRVRHAVSLLAGVCAISAPILPAAAQQTNPVYTWTNPGTGYWGTPSNWLPAGPPNHGPAPGTLQPNVIDTIAGSTMNTTGASNGGFILVNSLSAPNSTLELAGAFFIRSGNVGSLTSVPGHTATVEGLGFMLGDPNAGPQDGTLSAGTCSADALVLDYLTFSCPSVTAGSVELLAVDISVGTLSITSDFDGSTVGGLSVTGPVSWNVANTVFTAPSSLGPFGATFQDVTIPAGDTISGYVGSLQGSYDGVLTVEGTVDLDLQGRYDLAGTVHAGIGYVTNEGEFDLTNGAWEIGVGFENDGNLYLSPTAIVSIYDSVPNTGSVEVDGQLTVGVLDNISGTVSGNGTIEVVNNTGIVAPGHEEATGSLTINTLTQTAAGQIDIRIGGPQAASQYDVLNVGPGNMWEGGIVSSFGGAVNVSLINGYHPPVGTTFDIVRYTDRGTSAFSTVNLPANMSYAYVDGGPDTAGVLRVTVTSPKPAPMPRSARIVGPATVESTSGSNAYQLSVTFTDGSVQTMLFPPATLTVNGKAAPGGIVAGTAGNPLPVGWATLKATLASGGGQITCSRVIQVVP